tara:strand:+ start:5088 stop:6380 length:1293 start_codon:yes stop_codon:yes gene_type:complete
MYLTFPTQKQMHQYWEKLKTENKHNLRLIAEDTGNKNGGQKRYCLFTPEQLATRIEKNSRLQRNNCYYEIMPNSLCTYRHECKTCHELLKHAGTRFYLDIEFPDPCDWLNYQISETDPLEIGKSIKTFFSKCLSEEYKDKNYKIDFQEISSHRPGKYSWHYVAVIFDKDNNCEKLYYDCIAVSALLTKWAKQYKNEIEMYKYYETPENPKNAIDDSVYANHKCFRTPYSHKFGKKTGPLKPENNDISFEQLLVIQPYTDIKKQQFDLRGYMSTTKIFTSNKVLMKRKRVESPDLLEFEKIHKKNNNESVYRYSPHLYCLFSGWKPWKRLQNEILKHFPTTNFNQAQYKTIHKIYIPLQDVKKCPMGRGSNNGTHKSNSTFLFVYPSQGRVKWCCQDPSCKTRGGFKYLNIDMALQMDMVKEYNKKYTIEI